MSAGKPREGNAHEDPPPADSEAAEIVRSAPEPAAAIERQVSANRAAETNDAAAPAPRMAEVPMVPPALAPSAPAQQIAVRVSPKDGASVDLHVAERGGEIHVSVRTPDEALQTSLRQDLETLANSLERAGYRAETFTPREIAVAAPREGAMQPSNSRGNDSDAPAGGRGGSGNSSNPRQQQQSRGQNAKNWLEELENSK
ncbi:MAG TPA: flagellar hook-length control protein FliK [Bryobacteraceae bacterium]|nr:flagellar hook-length control protein FliK [Bryobacteraceae bacterium]